MAYTSDEKNRIDSLLEAARDDIQRWPIDFAYSHKIGYIHLVLGYEDEIEGSYAVENFEDMLLTLFQTAAFDVRSERLKEGDEYCYLYPGEKTKMRAIFEPTISRLPTEAERVYCMSALTEFIENFYDKHLDKERFELISHV